MNDEERKAEWTTDCMRYHGRVLTGSKSHWCPDWDYLPIDETCREIEVCFCAFGAGPPMTEET